MNKKLIALAVAGACVAPAAMAQTANPVVLYGRVYATLESVQAKGGPSGTAEVSARTRVSDQSSLLGVRGTEDLGGGLKAFFQLETAFKPDQNDTTFAARNSAVGLQGAWGSVLMGRWDMPFKTATIAVDPYGDLTISGITGVLNDQTNFDRRDQNVVQYWSPTWAGINFRLAQTANEGKTATLNPRDTGASVAYTGGPIYAFWAWEEHKDVSATVTKETGNAVGGNFSIGPVKLGAQYQWYNKDTRNKEKSWMGNVVWTIGNNQLIYQYMSSKGGQTNANLAKGVDDLDCKSNSVAYQYNFSKRTFVIASWVKVDNNDVSSCNFGSNRLAIAAGQDPEGAFVGIRHVF